MQNAAYYFLTVIIWGSTWIGIKLQLGTVSPIISVSYRFALAAGILLAWCRLRRLPMRFTIRDHLFMGLQGVLLFGINYLLFYQAELYIASGLAAVIFSTIMLMNMMNGSLFLGTPINRTVVAGGLLGLTGIALVFKPEISTLTLDNHGLRGVVFCSGATYLASLGNILSARNQKHTLPVVQSNAYGMAYGAFCVFGLAMLSGETIQIDLSAAYLGSLIYLAVFGSIIAFGCYLSLIGNIGADRAAYATLLFPLVALLISTIWEGYRWTGYAVCGVLFILSGNLVMLQHGKQKEVAIEP